VVKVSPSTQKARTAISAIASIEKNAEGARAAGQGSTLAVAARVIPVLHRALDRVRCSWSDGLSVGSVEGGRMSRAATKYLELIRELRLARLDHELRREPFAHAQEVESVSELDHWWREMMEDEQDAIERQLEGDTPEAPAELHGEDIEVEIGSERAPRREAA
jgi:hypothetical protein